MAATAQQILDAIDDAILAILAGGAVQSYMLPNGRQIQKCSLEQLQALRVSYQKLANSKKSGGTVNFARFDNP